MKSLIIFAFLFSTISFAQDNKESFKIIDLSQKQLRIVNSLHSKDSLTRTKVFIDSIYTPYKELWSGYIGDEQNFSRWINKEMIPNLEAYNRRNKIINGSNLYDQIREIKDQLNQMTGIQAKGNWYIFYGPAWTDLGGLANGSMLIDLTHKRNLSYENIIMMIPHEIVHQIYFNTNPHKDSTALGTIIGEGFAVYVNELYWGDKYSLAKNFGYTNEEMIEIANSEENIRNFFIENKDKTDKETIEKFRSRSFQLEEGLPGAIGYYLGYKLVQNYVNKFGKDAWRDVFIKSPSEIYELGGL